jgi:hypothetical protein
MIIYLITLLQIYLYLQIYLDNVSTITAIEFTTKCRFRVVAMLLFYLSEELYEEFEYYSNPFCCLQIKNPINGANILYFC